MHDPLRCQDDANVTAGCTQAVNCSDDDPRVVAPRIAPSNPSALRAQTVVVSGRTSDVRHFVIIVCASVYPNPNEGVRIIYLATQIPLEFKCFEFQRGTQAANAILGKSISTREALPKILVNTFKPTWVMISTISASL